MEGASNNTRQVFIVAYKRTPIGSLCGSLSALSGPQLAAHAIRGALEATKIDPISVSEVILGNVCSAGIGQNPARQAALQAGLPLTVPCTNVNKVCASGMKSVMLAAQAIAVGDAECVVAGGFESMSNIPFYVTNHRKGQTFGSQQLLDGLQHDGLTDAYSHQAMGQCAEKTAADFKITRQENDAFCVESYKRAAAAAKDGRFRDEIVPIKLDNGKIVAADEEPSRFKADKIPSLKPAFKKEGTITAANSSKINDGACAIILVSSEYLKRFTNVKPLARIVSYADAEVQPVDFCISPVEAGAKALAKARLEIKDIDLFEFNEAFSTTVLALMKQLGVSHDKTNIFGGAVAFGHPIGMSGARIIGYLLNALKTTNKRLGLAGICNGGGGSSAVIIESV